MAVDAIHDFTGRGETSTSRIQAESEERADAAQGQDKKTFLELIKEFSGDVNQMQFRAGHAIDTLATGEAADVHQVMVAVEQAGIALDLMLEIRNRVLEGTRN